MEAFSIRLSREDLTGYSQKLAVLRELNRPDGDQMRKSIDK